MDLALVHALQIDGRAPFSRIAAVLGVSDQTIARRYRRLRSSGAVRVLGLPNAHRLGHVQWIVRIHCTPDAAATIADALAKRQDTSWVSLTAGGTEIVCVTRARSTQERDALLLRKLPRTPRVVSVTAHCLLHVFFGGPTGWNGRGEVLTSDQVEQLRSFLPDPVVSETPLVLDERDERLMATLAVDGRVGYPELAVAGDCSESAAKRRLEHLRHHEALFFDVEIDAQLLGYETEAMLWLSVPPSELVPVAHALADHPEVAFAAATTGPTNLVASVACRNVEAFYRYLTDRVGVLRTVQHVESAPIIRSVKRAGVVKRSPPGTLER
ncbi:MULTISPECIES: Lrp/AsnC family transcriptional regulator [Streptomyces]|uniref:Lrp/AsnC family transcriptional regulator n=1 Tax=Streptomyces ramulosus TaxID=47762 RepID=A0ABW1FVB7_9ACTN